VTVPNSGAKPTGEKGGEVSETTPERDDSTARPWLHTETYNAAYGCKDHKIIARFGAPITNPPFATFHPADAELIVKAVNEREELLARAAKLEAALRGMLDVYEELHALHDLGDCDATVAARAALEPGAEPGREP
jgi:hypothetical protein